MKHLLIILNILLYIGSITAQNHYQFRTDKPQGFSVEQSTSTGLTLHYGIHEIDINTIAYGEAKGQEIVMRGSFGSFAEGLPNLPLENQYIAVPKGASISIEVKERASKTLDGIDLLPAAPVVTDNDSGMPTLKKEMSVFSKNACFPSENVVMASTTRIRGLDVALLSVTPFRYNPVRKTLEVIYDMDIEIRFEGGDGQFGDARYRNPDWDKILRDMVINSDMLPEANYYDLINQAVRNRDEGCEYLIIAPDDEDILTWADSLKRFRTRQGILTKVVTTTECGGNDTDHIKSYIQNAYNNWTIPPAALLIFNGYHDTIINDQAHALEGIPGFPLTLYQYDNYGQLIDRNYFSDNLYADMNGDSIPDIAISRLPALKPSEYQTQLAKLFEYETNPPTDPHYYDHPVITSSFENNKWFMITSQAVNGFFRDKLSKHPSNFYMPYEISPYDNTPDSLWSLGFNTSAPVDYFGPDGQGYFPRYLFQLDDWRNMFENQYLIDALSEGAFLTLYRDHSGSDLWCSPSFMSDEINKLCNEAPTFLLSIGCNTANYVQRYNSNSGDNLITAFCNTPIGALGGIGAVSVTRSLFNDIFTWGLVDHIWPNFMPTLGGTANPNFVRPVYAMVAGKMFLHQHVFMPDWWPSYINDTHNVTHFLGETYLCLNTEVPQPFDYAMAPYQPNSDANFRFKAEAGATVCLSNESGIIAVALATGEEQNVSLPQMAIGERFTVTMTKQNRIRSEKVIEVFDASSSFVYTKRLTFHDEDGNGQLDYGECASFDLELQNFGVIASEGAEISLDCESPHIEVLQNTARYPSMAPETTLSIANAFTIKLNPDVPDQTSIQFAVRFDDGHNKHCDNFTLIANAPVIGIEPTFDISDEQGEPSTHIKSGGKSFIAFHISNKGHSDSQLVAAELNLKAPFVELKTPVATIGQVQRGQTDTLVFEVNADGTEARPGWLQACIKLQDRENIIQKDTLVQYSAIYESFETDTLNPSYRWNYHANQWNYCEEDAWDGRRCFMTNSTDQAVELRTRMQGNAPNHNFKISFRYKTGNHEALTFRFPQSNPFLLSSDDWAYAEFLFSSANSILSWAYTRTDNLSPQAKIDDICFPPLHRAIVFAGHEIIRCDDGPVELNQAYAYDCNPYWMTNGDGVFENTLSPNTIYYPGDQDWANGEVVLKLFGIQATDTIASETRIRFVDEIALDGIMGDSVVNKFNQNVSRYSIEKQDGVNYVWQLHPNTAGILYDYGHTVDILWNRYETDTEVTLSVTTGNGCETMPVSKRINLVGYSVSEWNDYQFDLYPNPTGGKVTLVPNNNLQGKAVVEVFNLLGELMSRQNVSRLSKGQTLTLDMGKMGTGLYVVKLSTENGGCVKKLIVK